MPWMTSKQYLDANPDVKAAGVDALYHVLTYVINGPKEPRSLWVDEDTPSPTPDPDPTPTPTGEIQDFNRIPLCDGPSCYFSIGKVGGKLLFGEYGYQNGNRQSDLFEYPHSKVDSFNAESIFDICKHGGKYYLAVEHGKWDSVDRGIVYQLQGSTWVEVFRAANAELFFNLHSHGNYLYVTAGGSSGGVYRSADGASWETFIAGDSYCRWDMDTLDNHLYLCGAYGGDYGPGCRPAVWKDTTRIWDLNLDGAGFLGISAYKKDIYVSSATPARVYRLSDHACVLDLAAFEKIPKLIVDPKTDTLLALACRGDGHSSGAEVWATKDGSKWYQINGPWSCPHLYCAYYDEDTGDMWLGGGKWSQKSGGYGRIYKSVRG